MYMLKVLAPPAASVPPATVTSTSHRSGIPPFAAIIEGTVVIRSSSMMRGFVSITKAVTVVIKPLWVASTVVVLCSIERHDTAPNTLSPNHKRLIR